mmetsp:Transcript_33878/g.79214  ORF Transcript_33878/g.79214 Transcript_33878/m.79214 type:complete len:243 (+) Transcript_33878:272-1000(+)
MLTSPSWTCSANADFVLMRIDFVPTSMKSLGSKASRFRPDTELQLCALVCCMLGQGESRHDVIDRITKLPIRDIGALDCGALTSEPSMHMAASRIAFCTVLIYLVRKPNDADSSSSMNVSKVSCCMKPARPRNSSSQTRAMVSSGLSFRSTFLPGSWNLGRQAPLRYSANFTQIWPSLFIKRSTASRTVRHISPDGPMTKWHRPSLTSNSKSKSVFLRSMPKKACRRTMSKTGIESTSRMVK